MPPFYIEPPTSNLRFGDVVTGFHLAALRMDSPGGSATPLDIKIHVTRPNYFAVMTPCCSIELQSVSLAPIVEVRHKFFSFPRFAEELTRINAPMPAEEAVPPQHWAALSAERKGELIARGRSYVFYECFVYEPHAIFGKYELKKGKESWTVGHRMVDFKSIFRVDCNQIERDRDAPVGTKILQLTNATRAQLRDKLLSYFGRDADEAGG